MRQLMSQKNVAKLGKKLGLEIDNIQVRGGTDHRRDLYIKGGEILATLFKNGEMKWSGVNWAVEPSDELKAKIEILKRGMKK